MKRENGKRTLPLLIVVVNFLIYYNSLDGEFIFDDETYIVRNDNIRSFQNSFQGNSRQEARPTLFASLAFNYALGGLIPKGYHVVNLLIHILAALTLYQIILRTLHLPKLRGEFEGASHRFAFAATLIWSVHPLQADCVAYVFQRGESMQSLFYLLGVLSFIRGASTHGVGRALWTAAVIVAAALGMGCKATFMTLPAILLLYDRVFLSRSFVEAIVRRWSVFLGTTLTILLVGAAVTQVPQMVVGYTELTPLNERDLSFGYAGDPLEYYRSQPTVLLSYLKLAFFPDALCLDYFLKPVSDFVQIALTSTAVLILLGLTGFTLHRYPPLGFCLTFMFIVLSPTLVYWKMELMFAYRMYLPLAGMVCFTIFTFYGLLQRLVMKSGLHRTVAASILATSLTLCAAALCARTVVYNRSFRDPVAFYLSVVETRPGNPRGRYNLANRLVDRYRTFKTKGDLEQADVALREAILHYREAIRLFPKYIDAHINLAAALSMDGQTDAVIDQLKKAVSWYPTHPTALHNLALGLKNRGLEKKRSGRSAEAEVDLTEAVIYYKRALTEKPEYKRALSGLGTSLYALGRYSEAVVSFETYLRFAPEDTKVLRLLADAHFRLTRYADAKRIVLRYLQAEPQSRWGRNFLRRIQNHSCP